MRPAGLETLTLVRAFSLQTYIHRLESLQQNLRANYQSFKINFTIKSSCHYIEFLLTLLHRSKLKAKLFEYTRNSKFKLTIPIVMQEKLPVS